MAFSEFYMQTTGDNINSGSTTDNAALVTSTNGDWGNAAANRFTAASGTPFSAVNIGDWASIYLDGATSAVYIAQVTAVNAGGASLDFSSTIKIGTAPTSGATGRSCKVGGAWASPAVFTSISTTTVAVSTRLNVKAGTYASTTTSRTCAIGGATTTPFWIRGYNATPGDLANDFTTTKPAWTWTTGAFTLNATHVIISNLSITSAIVSGAALTVSLTNNRITRCRLENTNAGASSRAFSNGATGTICISCWFKATTTVTEVIVITGGLTLHACTIEGGGHGVSMSGASLTAHNCYFKSNGNHGVNMNSSAFALNVFSSTFSGITNDGIRFVATPTSCFIVSCNFTGCGGYDINNNTGTNTNLVTRLNNNSYNTGSGHENGFGDSPRFATQTDSASAVTNSSNPTPPSGSTARSNGYPGNFEAMSITSYRDIGCVQHQDSGGSTPKPWMIGG